MTRPRSITLTALVSAWFGIGSSASAVLGALGSGAGFPLPGILLASLAVFGLTGLAAARALWSMRPTGPTLLLLLGAAGVLLALALPSSLGSAAGSASLWSAAITGGALFGLLCLWQSRRLRAMLAGIDPGPTPLQR